MSAEREQGPPALCLAVGIVLPAACAGVVIWDFSAHAQRNPSLFDAVMSCVVVSALLVECTCFLIVGACPWLLLRWHCKPSPPDDNIHNNSMDTQILGERLPDIDVRAIDTASTPTNTP